jgi:membrane protein
MNRRSVWQFLKDIFTQWIEDEPFLLASSLSYYTLVSLTPLLVIAIAVAGLVFGREAAQNEIVQTIGGMIGPESRHFIPKQSGFCTENLKFGRYADELKFSLS